MTFWRLNIYLRNRRLIIKKQILNSSYYNMLWMVSFGFYTIGILMMIFSSLRLELLLGFLVGLFGLLAMFYTDDKAKESIEYDSDEIDWMC